MNILRNSRSKIHSSILIIIILFNVCDNAEPETFDSVYESGVNSYLEERWSECIDNFERIIELYNTFIKTLVNCRLKCKQELNESDVLFPENIENLHFYENTIKNTLCVLKCKNSHGDLFKKYTLSKKTEQLFEDRKPYEYLHICYFQKNKIQDAASAAFTYLVKHPKDEAMIKNLRYYASLPEVDMKEVLNLEAKDYVYLYTYGSNAYENKDWHLVIQYMEESLTAYLQAEEECRAQCEGPFDQGWFPDFTASVANHFTYCLKCKQRCPTKLNVLNGEVHDDLLPSHYHFLQFAYFKVGDIKKACECVASYLLFYPDDEVMLSNKDYYTKKSETENELFTPRQEAVEYIQRQKYEQKLLHFIDTAFVYDVKTEKVEAEQTVHKIYYRNTERNTIVMDEKYLNGLNRFLIDGIITDTECDSLIQLAQMYAVEGDGYYGNKSPHTKMELFAGVTLGRVALLVYFGLMEPKLLELYLTITDIAKDYMRGHFNITNELYFTYTHLVCRSALSELLNRTDFSHVVHADNCNLQEDMQCLKEPPSYTWRDYSAIIYLNNNFDGGEFIFSEDKGAKHIQSSIKPKCGRMIGFTSGPENLHGVRAVLRGMRCAIGVWFTLNPKYQEIERILAYKLLNKIYTTDKNAQDLIFNELQKYVNTDITKVPE